MELCENDLTRSYGVDKRGHPRAISTVREPSIFYRHLSVVLPKAHCISARRFRQYIEERRPGVTSSSAPGPTAETGEPFCSVSDKVGMNKDSTDSHIEGFLRACNVVTSGDELRTKKGEFQLLRQTRIPEHFTWRRKLPDLPVDVVMEVSRHSSESHPSPLLTMSR